jgi:hypothetical protein
MEVPFTVAKVPVMPDGAVMIINVCPTGGK